MRYTKVKLLFVFFVVATLFCGCRKVMINFLFGRMEKKIDSCREVTLKEMEDVFKQYPSYLEAVWSIEMGGVKSRYEDRCSEIKNIGANIGKLVDNHYGFEEETKMFNRVTALIEKMIKLEEEIDALHLKYKKMSID